MCSFAPPPTPEIYTLSLHDALPISPGVAAAGLTGAQGTRRSGPATSMGPRPHRQWEQGPTDRKSTRLNSSHANISYAVFCLKKKNDEESTFKAARGANETLILHVGA